MIVLKNFCTGEKIREIGELFATGTSMGKCEGKKRRGCQRTRWLDSVIEATNMNLTQLRKAVEGRGAWRALVHGVMKSRTQRNN